MPQFKKFTAETVEVSEMNDYLASQVVGTFDSVSARSAYFAGGGAFTVTEGMVTYLKDTGEFQVYKSSGWTTIGAKGDAGATGATGASGATGATGAAGSAGAAASITLGAVTTGAPGTDVAVTNTGSSSAAVFNFAIPRGLQGPTGAAGSNGSTGATGATGAEGPRGQAATINVGTVTTGASGSSASVSNAGNTTDAVFNFVLPRGDSGTITVGTVTTGAAGTAASVTNSGTSTQSVLNFVIPQGPQGVAGAGTGDVVAANANTFTTNQVITGSSASAMLRITQTGAGNALVVEDSANPDSSPFVIDASGNVLIGATSGTGSSALEIFSDGSLGQTIRGAGGAGGRILLQRLNGTNAAPTTVAANNVLGQILVSGYSGSAYTNAAAINFFAEGTISAGVVPGAIAFTIANSAGTLTERFRIDSAGRFGMGTTTVAGRGINIGVSMTGTSQPNGIFNAGTIQSDATSGAVYYNTWANTAASAGAIPSVTHYQAFQGSIGASSSIVTQIGFLAGNTLTGGTTNCGFQGSIAAATGRYNLYMDGTADNYLAGSLGIGAAPSTGINLRVIKNMTGAINAYGITSQGVVQSDVTSSAYSYYSGFGTQATTFTLGNLIHYAAVQGTIGVGSTVTEQIGFYVSPGTTGATSNFGFRSAIPAAANRWNLYMNGTADNYLAGRLGVGATLTSGAMAQVTNTTAADVAFIVKGAASQTGDLLDIQNSAGTSQLKVTSAGAVGVGGTPLTGRSFVISRSITGGGASFGLVINAGIQSDVTSEAQIFRSGVSTAAASFTLTNLINYHVAGIATPGAGSSITNQYGFFVDSGLTGATNNYAYGSDIASATGRWNLYMAGTAANYLAGNLCVGTTAIATSANKAIHMGNGTAPSANIASGGILYVESGALKYRGSSGTITTLGAA